MKSRDLALVAILLAIGAVIYAFTPSIGGIFTIDTVASFAVLGILGLISSIFTLFYKIFSQLFSNRR